MKSNLLIGLAIALLLIIYNESLHSTGLDFLLNADQVAQTQPPCNPKKDKNCQ